jgi:hypothetical protein
MADPNSIIARKINQSPRGWYLISQALDIAIKEMKKVKEPHKETSNIADMELLREYIFNCPIYDDEEVRKILKENNGN